MKLIERANRITGLTAVLTVLLIFALSWSGPSFASVDVEVPVRVSFEGKNLPEESFTVELRSVNTGQVITESVKLSEKNRTGIVELKLGDLPEGVHVYNLRQLKGSSKGVTYSSDEFTYYVGVNANGTIVRRAVDKTDETNKPDTVEFVNRYTNGGNGDDEVIGDPPVRVRKDISGKKPPEDERFTFIMQPEKEGQPLPDVESTGKGAIKDGIAEVYLNGTGEIEIGNITFKEEGVYRYFVSEKEGSSQGYDYDDARFTVTYEVTRDEDGKLSCERTISGKNGEKAEACSFDNIYDPNPVRREIHRIVKTGDPGIMWPLAILIASGMMLAAIMLNKRFRRDSGCERDQR